MDYDSNSKTIQYITQWGAKDFVDAGYNLGTQALTNPVLLNEVSGGSAAIPALEIYDPLE